MVIPNGSSTTILDRGSLGYALTCVQLQLVSW